MHRRFFLVQMAFNSVAVAKSMDAAGPRDIQDPPANGPLGEPEPEQAEDLAIQYPEGITEEMVLTVSKERRQKYNTWISPQLTKLEEAHKMFEGLPFGSNANQKQGTFVPIVNPIIETDTAKRLTSMFSKSKIVDAEPLEPNPNDPSNENKQDVEDLINQQILSSSARIPEKSYDAFKGQGIEGTCFWKSFWDQESRILRQPQTTVDPMSGQPVITGISESDYICGFPNAEPKPLQNLCWDPPVGTRIQDSPFVGEFDFKTMNQLLVMEQKGIIQNVQVIVQRTSALSQDNDKDKEKKRITALGEHTGSDTPGAKSGVYEIGEWWAELTWQKPQEDGSKVWTSEEFHFWIANEQTVIKFESNPLKPQRKPYISSRHSILPRRLLGAGAASPIKGLQLHANGLQASKQDLIKKAAQNPTFYSKASGLDVRKTMLTENSLIAVQNPKEIQHFPIDTQAIQAVSADLEGTIGLARETVPANEQMQGIPGQGDQTATGESLDAQGANIRLQAITDLSGYEFFAALALEFYRLNQQFAGPSDLVVRTSSINGQPRALTPMDLVGNYIFQPITSASQMNKQNQMKNMAQVMEQIGKMEIETPQLMVDAQGIQMRFDAMEFLIKEVLPLAGVRNGRSYWQKMPPMPMGMPGASGMPQAPGRPGMPSDALNRPAAPPPQPSGVQ